jgi:hypothetical protein
MEACIISAERLVRRSPATISHLSTIILYTKWAGFRWHGMGNRTGMARWRANKKKNQHCRGAGGISLADVCCKDCVGILTPRFARAYLVDI